MNKAPIYVILGSIGSGKTHQATALQQVIDAQILSTGSIIRLKLADDPRVEHGELLPDHLVEKIIRESVAEIPDNTAIIFDGFPRTASQKQWLDEYAEQIKRPIRQVFFLDVSEAEVDRRLSQRNRADDTQAAIAARKTVFNQQTLPVIDLYRTDGLLTEVDGDSDPDSVTKSLIAELKV